ncbi:MAG: 16S rRNA (uracil(1498)-N(3))-methyltransferase [Flavobacteriaceae bacterium]|nr:16S rRNA (uracil(1498)-N(3))-methyltransferase [Flavobacteriaceae bacterium]
MQLFYNPDINSSITEFIFNKEEGRHIVRVLRKKEGDLLYITNGKGFLFKVQIIHANDKKCLVKMISFEEKEKNWNYYLHIAIAPTKMNDRFEWFLEKATEIGIDEITPIICDNSERKVLKAERMQKVLVSAMKQSLKYELPKLNKAIKFSELIQTNSADIKLIAHCEDPDKKNTIKNLVKPKKNMLVLIGPEGDFSPKEISYALQHQFIPLSLGSNRLRTETAGIVACSSISVINEK